MEFNELMLSTSREIIFMTDINEESAIDLIQRIAVVNNIDDEMERSTAHLKDSYNREEHPIVIRLSCVGGEITSGYNIVTAIKTSRTPVVIIASGIIASMGLYMVASAHHRIADESTEFMFHQPSAGHRGTLMETQSSVDRVKRMEERYMNFLIKRSGGKLEKDYLRELASKNLDHWFTAEEALEKWGIIDAVITDDEFYNPDMTDEEKEELILESVDKLDEEISLLEELTGKRFKLILDETEEKKETKEEEQKPEGEEKDENEIVETKEEKSTEQDLD